MLAVIVIIGLLVSPAYAVSVPVSMPVSMNDVLTFLGDKTSPQVQEKFSRLDVNASPCVVEQGEVVYSLCVVPVQKGFGVESVRIASLKAAGNLARYLDDGKTITKGYANREAVNRVIRSHYERRAKFSSSGKIIGGNAFGLVWAKKIHAPMPAKDFNEKYCSLLYDEGQELFSSGRYAESAKKFRDVNYREWANVEAYLGASVCLLIMGSNDDAANLAGEVVRVFSKDMTPDEIASAGRVLFNAGRKDEGFDVLEHAYNLRR